MTRESGVRQAPPPNMPPAQGAWTGSLPGAQPPPSSELCSEPRGPRPREVVATLGMRQEARGPRRWTYKLENPPLVCTLGPTGGLACRRFYKVISPMLIHPPPSQAVNTQHRAKQKHLAATEQTAPSFPLSSAPRGAAGHEWRGWRRRSLTSP